MFTKKIDFTKFKFKINNLVIKAVLISFLTMIVTLGVITFFVWHYRAKIFNMLAVGYAKSQQVENNGLKEKSNSLADNLSQALPFIKGDSVAREEGGIVDVVKKANPAVVSVIVSKEVPKYDVSYNQTNPFGDLFGNDFPNLFFQTPTYKQNGTEKQEIGGGSGFLISGDGMIVTNRHVVSDTSAEYTVILSNGKKYVAKILARDPVLDVAVIKITPPIGTVLPYLELANSDTLELGQSVVAIGNALGQFKNSVSQGIISGLSRSITAGDNAGNSEQLDKVIQTDAAINPGNSGGPLLNLSGQVVGINVAVVQGSENVGFALPINSVESAIDSVRRTGKIVRPYVGIRYVVIDDALKNKNNLSVNYGILVQRGQTATELAVIPGSPADKAGIVENDIILEINGIKIDETQSFLNLIRNKNVGDVITMKVISKGVEKTVSVTLAAAPEGV
jgi:serine protease Do